MKRSQRKDTSSRQQGSLTVELALVLAFVLMPLLAGVVDLGQVLLAQAVVTRAAREGGLAASRRQNVGQVVNLYMQNAGYQLDRVTVTTEGGGTTGTEVTVRVGYDITGMGIIPWQNISPSMTQVVGLFAGRQS